MKWREITRERTPSQDPDDFICLHEPHSGPGTWLLVGIICHLLVFLHCRHLKLSLTLDFVKVNKRIMDDNNPPWSTMRFSQCLTIACLIEQIKKKSSVFPALTASLHYQEHVGIIIHRCVELANEQLLFICFWEQSMFLRDPVTMGRYLWKICPLTPFQDTVAHLLSSFRSVSTEVVWAKWFFFYLLLTIKAAVGPGSRF